MRKALALNFEYTKTLAHKPELVVNNGNLPATTLVLRDVLASANSFYDRGVPVRLVHRPGGVPHARPLTFHGIVMEAHRLCEVVTITEEGEPMPVTLPTRVARMYLDIDEWNLPQLAGIATAPLLGDTGELVVQEGIIARRSGGAPTFRCLASPTTRHAATQTRHCWC